MKFPQWTTDNSLKIAFKLALVPSFSWNVFKKYFQKLKAISEVAKPSVVLNFDIQKECDLTFNIFVPLLTQWQIWIQLPK